MTAVEGPKPTPTGYERREAGSAEGLAVPIAATWLEEILGSGLTLHEWAAACNDVEPLHGRGTVFSIAAPTVGPDARTRWAVRHYQRGGAAVSFLGDRYWRGGDTRPEREIRASVAARARGVPTPAVIAGAWYRSGLFYRADLVTELVPDTISLAESLFSDERDSDRAATLARSGALVRDLETKGIVHADLNAMNILVGHGGVESMAYVIDLDRARVVDTPIATPRDSMRRRLTRSLHKLEESTQRRLSVDEWAALRAGFEGKA